MGAGSSLRLRSKEVDYSSGSRRKSKSFPLLSFVIFAALVLFVFPAYSVWEPGLVITDGRHDLGRNGIWIQHGWLGDDGWFARNRKVDRKAHFRNPARIRELAALFRRHGITDVFPHLCPTAKDGTIPPVDAGQADRFLEEFDGFRVLPWVGGVAGLQAYPEDLAWRHNFVRSVRALLSAHPEFAGVHVNIEPCPSGSLGYLALLEELRSSIPGDKVLSVAAYPPPTLWHPFPSVHWDRSYMREVSRRADQVVVMIYDTGLRFEKVYRWLISRWTREVLDWSGRSDVLLGLPAYRDEGVGYHHPKVENLENAIAGVHSGLSRYDALPGNYRGIAIYCEWEMDEGKWEVMRHQFLRR
jgi:hypothetical protein